MTKFKGDPYPKFTSKPVSIKCRKKRAQICFSIHPSHYPFPIMQTAQSKSANNDVWEADDIFILSLYGHIHVKLKSSTHILSVALAKYKAMGLCPKFDKKMKEDSNLLIIEATCGFCLLC